MITEIHVKLRPVDFCRPGAFKTKPNPLITTVIPKRFDADRVEEIMSQVYDKGVGLVDGARMVMSDEELAYVWLVRESMPGSASWVDAFFAIYDERVKAA